MTKVRPLSSVGQSTILLIQESMVRIHQGSQLKCSVHILTISQFKAVVRLSEQHNRVIRCEQYGTPQGSGPMARPLALGARHRGGSSPLYPTQARWKPMKYVMSIHPPLIGIQLNWLEHSPDTRKVESSSLSIPTNKVIVPRVGVATSGLKKSKVTDGCVTPY